MTTSWMMISCVAEHHTLVYISHRYFVFHCNSLAKSSSGELTKCWSVNSQKLSVSFVLCLPWPIILAKWADQLGPDWGIHLYDRHSAAQHHLHQHLPPFCHPQTSFLQLCCPGKLLHFVWVENSPNLKYRVAITAGWWWLDPFQTR